MTGITTVAHHFTSKHQLITDTVHAIMSSTNKKQVSNSHTTAYSSYSGALLHTCKHYDARRRG